MKIGNRASKTTKVLGLSGGIASGKTTVARMFESLGAAVISADEIAHETLKRPSVRRQIRRRWGRGVFRPDGSVDRKRLGAVVFNSPAEVRALEAITHPPILREIKGRMRAFSAGGKVPLIVLDAPLLNEARLDRLCHAQVFVTAKKASRVRRAGRERRWSRGELARRESRQMPLAEKRRRADFIIDNSGTRAATRAQVRRVCEALVRLESVGSP
jgi:dephospho-CoA kinase